MNHKLITSSVNAELLARCLTPLLQSLLWRGNRRILYESLPHFYPIASLDDFCSTMNNLGYEHHTFSTQLSNLDLRLLPCLYVPQDGGSPKVLLKTADGQISIFDSAHADNQVLTPTDGTGRIIVFRKKDRFQEEPKPANWFKKAIEPKMHTLYYLGFLTALQVTLMLASPIFIISVYDQVVTTGSISMLVTFSLGVLMAMVSLGVIMMTRSRLLAYLGCFVQRRVGEAILRQILELPPVYTESVTIGMQITRLNDFASVREFFGSTLLGTLIELPFLFIYLLVIWIIGGWLVLVPIIFVGVFALVTYIIWRFMQKSIQEGSVTKTRREEFLVETLQRMHSLQFAGMQETWRDRFRRLNSQVSLMSQKLAFLNIVNDSVFDALIMIAGLTTLAAGVMSVLSEAPGEHLQIGALIGTMFIIWRVLSPLKVIGISATRLTQLKRSVLQIDNLMRIPRESQITKDRKNSPWQLIGAVAFSQVSFRYPGSETTLLSGINFSIKPGQILAITGPSSAGKSTIVKLILGMYSPQIGNIFIDGRDIQQYDTAVLRTQIAYVPQKAELFYGTVAQNLKLSDPTATDAQLIQAAKEANLLKDVMALPKKFDTRVKDYGDRQMSASFCQKICLARAYLRHAPILILDEPATALDEESDIAMMEMLQRAKGKQTVIIITHRPSHIKLADLVVLLSEGKQMLVGDPNTVLEKMPKGWV